MEFGLEHKDFWLSKITSQLLIQSIKLILGKSCQQVSTFDFSTLYTKRPHDKLLAVLNSIIESAFRSVTRDKIYVLKVVSATFLLVCF